MKQEALAIEAMEDSGILTHDGIDLIQYTISLPFLKERTPRARRINRFYAAVKHRFLHQLRKRLLPRQAALCADALAQKHKYTPPEYRLCFTVTQNDGTCLSILREVTVYDAACRCVRAADLWDAHSGWPLSAADFFPRNANVKKQVAKLVAAQAQKRCRHEPHLKGLRPRKIRRAIAADGFYLKNDALTLFFNPGTLVPAAAGTLEFPLSSVERFPEI